MSNLKNEPFITINTGSAEEFFQTMQTIMRHADQGKSLARDLTITFEEPSEMLHFLSKTKLNLIKFIRHHPDSVTNIAKAINRQRASVSRDITELTKVGLLKTYETINPGHGRHKIIQVVASNLKLEAYL